MLPISIALYGVETRGNFLFLPVIICLGAFAISAPGTLYAAISADARSKDVLLPLLLFPVLVPAILAAVKTTALVMEGDPMGQFQSWLTLLIGFNLMYWFLTSFLFSKVIEE